VPHTISQTHRTSYKFVVGINYGSRVLVTAEVNFIGSIQIKPDSCHLTTTLGVTLEDILVDPSSRSLNPHSYGEITGRLKVGMVSCRVSIIPIQRHRTIKLTRSVFGRIAYVCQGMRTRTRVCG
jgi:hypothetical protein